MYYNNIKYSFDRLHFLLLLYFGIVYKLRGGRKSDNSITNTSKAREANLIRSHCLQVVSNVAEIGKWANWRDRLHFSPVERAVQTKRRFVDYLGSGPNVFTIMSFNVIYLSICILINLFIIYLLTIIVPPTRTATSSVVRLTVSWNVTSKWTGCMFYKYRIVYKNKEWENKRKMIKRQAIYDSLLDIDSIGIYLLTDNLFAIFIRPMMGGSPSIWIVAFSCCYIYTKQTKNYIKKAFRKRRIDKNTMKEL